MNNMNNFSVKIAFLCKGTYSFTALLASQYKALNL